MTHVPDLTDPQPWDPDSDDDGDCKIPPAENYHVLKAERDALRERVEGLVEALTDADVAMRKTYELLLRLIIRRGLGAEAPHINDAIWRLKDAGATSQDALSPPPSPPEPKR